MKRVHSEQDGNTTEETFKLEIIITEKELLQAAENLIDTQDLGDRVNKKAIACIIMRHLESRLEEILSDPEDFLEPQEWRDADRYFKSRYLAHKQVMRNIYGDQK